MAFAYLIKFSIDAQKWQRLSSGQALSILGGQASDTISVDLSDGTQKVTDPAAESALYKIVLSGGDALLRIGENAAADAGAEPWFDGDRDVRFVRTGERIAIKAR